MSEKKEVGSASIELLPLVNVKSFDEAVDKKLETESLHLVDYRDGMLVFHLAMTQEEVMEHVTAVTEKWD